MPYVTLPSCLPTFLRVEFELTECLESLCKSPHLGAVGCKPKIYFSSKIGSPGRAEQEETKAENRKLGYGKTQEARLQLPGRAGEVGYGVVLGPRPGAGAEGALETQLQVQHLQEELNTRLLGQLCWNNRPPVQLVVAGPVQRVGVEPVTFALAEDVLSEAGAILRFRELAWCRSFRLWGA